jgi:hypothetical protein
VQAAGTPPRSTFSANYAVDVDAPKINPLNNDLVAAAQEDRRGLGLPALQFAAPPRLGSLPGDTAVDGAGLAMGATGSSPPASAGSPAARNSPDPGDQHSSLPVLPIVVAVVVVASGTWGAVYLFRPTES